MTNPAIHTSGDDGYDSVSALMRYEAGELDEAETIRLFQHLVSNGLAWKLQGNYARRARDLLEAGRIQPPAGDTPAPPPADKSRFPLGQTVATANALDRLRPDEIALGLARHVRGDWGNVPPEDAEANDEALLTGERLHSAYGEGDRRFWIITERDRSVTTVLMPEDY
jgi:hypothetical protein